MRKTSFLFITLFCLSFGKSYAQNVAINENGNTANPSAILDVQSTTKGLLVPRMTEAQRTAIVSPAKGLLVYQTDNKEGYYVNSGTDVSPNWIKLAEEKSPVAFSSSIPTSLNIPASGNFTKVQFHAEEYDESNNFAAGAASEFIAPLAGIYHFDAALHIFNTMQVSVAIFVNDVMKKANYQAGSGTYQNGVFSVSTDLKLATGDKVDVRVLLSSGGQFPGTTNNPYSTFSGHRVN